MPTKTWWGVVASLGLGLGVIACSQGGGMTGAAQLTDSQVPLVSGMPTPAELPRQASAVQKLSAGSYVAQQGGTPNGMELVLSLLPSTGGTAGEGEPPELLPYAFAIYQFSEVELQPAALSIAAVADYQTKFYVGLADWDKGCWDFSPGSFFSSPGFALGDFSGGPGKFVSDDGRVAVVIMLGENGAPLHIQSLELTYLTDVQGFAGSTTRWDGVMLTWEEDASAAGYTIYRRVANAPAGEPWVPLTEEPLDRTVEFLLDNSAEGTTLYDYVIKSAYRFIFNGKIRWMYSPGVLTAGLRQVSSVKPGPEGVVKYWPANFYNRVSFFWQPEAGGGGVEGVVNNGFPAIDSWQEQDILPDGSTPVVLTQFEDFAPPFQVFQSEEVNSTALTVGYTTTEGMFAQVATVTSDGEVSWEPAVQVRGSDSYFLGFVQLPRRLGAVSWNMELNRMELVDSIDSTGRYWYEFEPETFPWMLITDRKPDSGTVDMEYFTAAEIISFREAETHEVIVIKHGFNEWIDMSPGITVGSRPRLMLLMSPGQPSSFSLVYLDESGHRIRLLRQSTQGQWLLNEIEELVLAKSGEQIDEFDIYTSGEVSYANYLIYVLDGDLYLRYTNHPGLQGLQNPLLVDNSGDVHDLNLIRVGTDGSFTQTNLFATYYSRDADGIQRINFRDLLAIHPLY